MTEVDLTSEAYARWLRAMRPPLTMFLGLSTLEQEALAKLGDNYQSDFCVAIGMAIKDPELADAGIHALDDPEAEEVLLRRMMAQTIGESQQKKTPNGLTMGGLGQRRQEAEKKQSAPRGSLFGRPPDGGEA